MALWSSMSLALAGIPLPGTRALTLRGENLACLGALALALRFSMVRLLEPWLGRNAARSAALASAFFLVLHPQSPTSVGGVAARPELAGLLLALVASTLFLKGRQEEREPFTIAGLALLGLAGFASSVAIVVALFLAIAEFSSVRRDRRRSLRIRTAATTAVVFGAVAGLARLVLEKAGPLEHPAFAGLSAGSLLSSRIQSVGEAVGELVLPAGPGVGFPGVILAGVLFLLAIQPAFRAARHAPRLWGGMLAVWSLMQILAIAWSNGNESESGGGLLPLIVWASGLGLAVTARFRPRNVFLAVALVLGWSVLAHARGRVWRDAASAQAQLWEQLSTLEVEESVQVLVLDPPAVRGAPSLALDLGWLFHPRLDGPGSAETFDPRRVQALTSPAFLALVACGALEELRAKGPISVVRPFDSARAGPPSAVSLSAPTSPATPVQSWRGLTYTPPAPLDTREWEFARIVAELSSGPEEIEKLGWKTRDGESGGLSGRLVERGGRHVAEFDLSSSLEWLLVGSVRSLLIEKGVHAIERGEIHRRLPVLEGVDRPEVDAADWLFAPAPPGGASEPAGRYQLTLLALSAYELCVIPLQPHSSGGLRARDAQAFVSDQARVGGSVAWILDYRVGSSVLSRARGRTP